MKEVIKIGMAVLIGGTITLGIVGAEVSKQHAAQAESFELFRKEMRGTMTIASDAMKHAARYQAEATKLRKELARYEKE